MIQRILHKLTRVAVLIVLCAISAISFARSAQAQSCNYCFRVEDQEARKQCKALCHDQPSWCGHIRDYDDRQYCYARVHSDARRCRDIRDGSLEAQCRAELE